MSMQNTNANFLLSN